MTGNDLELVRARTVATVAANPGADCFAIARAMGIDPSAAEVMLDKLNAAGILRENAGCFHVTRSKAPALAKADPERVVSPSGHRVDVVYQRR